MEELKRCRSCKQLKPLHRFGKNKACPDGLRAICKNCKAKVASRCYKKRIKNKLREKQEMKSLNIKGV